MLPFKPTGKAPRSGYPELAYIKITRTLCGRKPLAPPEETCWGRPTELSFHSQVFRNAHGELETMIYSNLFQNFQHTPTYDSAISIKAFIIKRT